MSTDNTRTDAQREASRTNGAKSHGPVTPEGKARSSQNGIKHGLRSPRVVLANESRERYQALLDCYLTEWNPVGVTEAHYLMRMVNADWRMRRIDSIRDATLDSEMFLQRPSFEKAFKSVTPAMRQSDAVTGLNISDPGVLEYLGREYARLERSLDRARKQLLEMQTARLGHAPILLPQPVTFHDSEANDTTEPEMTGHNFESEEEFWWNSAFIPTRQRPSQHRPDWTNDSHAPEDRAA